MIEYSKHEDWDWWENHKCDDFNETLLMNYTMNENSTAEIC